MLETSVSNGAGSNVSAYVSGKVIDILHFTYMHYRHWQMCLVTCWMRLTKRAGISW